MAKKLLKYPQNLMLAIFGNELASVPNDALKMALLELQPQTRICVESIYRYHQNYAAIARELGTGTYEVKYSVEVGIERLRDLLTHYAPLPDEPKVNLGPHQVFRLEYIEGPTLGKCQGCVWLNRAGDVGTCFVLSCGKKQE